MTRVVLSIGSNLGDRMAALQSVLDGLGESVTAVSPVYESDPWGGVEQGPFLNAVLLADDPTADPYAWLRRAHGFERGAGRVRDQRWGPRTLDVDLIAGYPSAGAAEVSEVSEVRVDDGDLTLPHPRAHLRAFVLVPWLDVEPDAQLSIGGAAFPVAELLAELDPAERAGVRPHAQTLDPRAG